MPGRLASHLPSTVAALAAQVLAMGQQAGGTGALQGQPGVDEGRGTTVVIHKERLRRERRKNPESGMKKSGIVATPVTHILTDVRSHDKTPNTPSQCGRVSSPSPGGALAAYWRTC